MKNFKKLFAIVATAAMLTTMVNTSTFAAGYSDELQGAYDYAYGIGATTQSTIDSANMYGNLIRAHAAKILVNYAKEVLNRTPDTSVEVNFSDIADQSSELQAYIVEAAQLGIMGVNPDGSVADKFNPNGVVTRAQFGTILSRILYGDKNEGGTPYYKNHLEALNEAGIMKNISNPDSIEVRGYVFLMLERAADGSDVSETCSQPDVIFACTLGTSACPEECKDAVVTEETNGNLAVKMSSSNGGDVPYGVPALQVATYKFTADEDIRLDSITLKRGGYSDTDTLDGASLFINGGRVSKVTKFNSDKEAVVSITNGYSIKAGQSVEIAAVVSVGDSDAANDQFSIALTKVSSTAEDVDYASDLTSDTFKVLNKENATIAYTVQSAVENPKAGEEGAELFEFKLNNSSSNDQDATLKTITFKEGSTSTIDTDDLENFQLVVDGEVIAKTDGYVGKYLTFNVEDGYSIKEGKSPIFTVKADVTGGAGEKVSFVLDNATDLSVIGDTYDIAMNVTGSTTVSNYVTVSAGKVSIAKVNTAAGELLRNKDNIFLGAFTISNKAGESLSLQDLSFNFNTGAILENVKVKLGSTSASPIDLNDNTAGTGWSETDLDKSIGSSLTVYVYADTKDVAVGNVSLTMKLADIAITETQNDEDVSDITPTTLTWSTMNGTDSALSLTNVALGDKTVSEGTEAVEAISFKIKASDAVGTIIKKMTFVATGVDSDTITAATLYNGTTEIAASVKNGTIVVDDDFTIAAGKTAALVLKVDTATDPELTGVQYVLTGSNIDAVENTDDQDDINIGGNIAGRIITITDKGVMQQTFDSTTTNNKYNKNILGGSSVVVAEYGVYSKYEAVNVDTATVKFSTGTNVKDKVLDVQLYYGDEMVASDPTWNTNKDTATFEDLDFDTATAKKALTVKVVSKAINEENGNVSLGNTSVVSVVLGGLKGADSGEDVDNYTVSGAVKSFNIVPVSVIPAVTTVGTTKGTFTVTASAGDNETTGGDEAKATLKTVLFTVDGDNGSLQGLTIKDDAGAVVGSMVAVSGNGTFTGTFNKELSNGTTTFTVSAVVSGSINTPSYNVSISALNYSTNVDNNVASFASEFGAAKDLITK